MAVAAAVIEYATAAVIREREREQPKCERKENTNSVIHFPIPKYYIYCKLLIFVLRTLHYFITKRSSAVLAYGSPWPVAEGYLTVSTSNCHVIIVVILLRASLTRWTQ